MLTNYKTVSGRTTGQGPSLSRTVSDAALERLEAISQLKVGWDSYRAKAPSAAAVRQAMQILADYARTVRAAGWSVDVGPIIDGGVQIYFVKGELELDVLVDNSGRVTIEFDDEEVMVTAGHQFDEQIQRRLAA